MKPDLFADEIDGRLFAAVVRGGALDALYTDAGDETWGAVYRGKVVKVDTKLGAALVDLGGGAQGLLPEDAATGQEVTVIVRSEGRDQKLPRLKLTDEAPRAAPTALQRALADYDFEHIYIARRELLAQIPEPLASTKRVRLEKNARLFETHDLFSAIEALKEKHVDLAGGGSLVIEHTAALTVIDVNQGSASSAAEANAAAAVEAARQCRLRDLSGAILIDFINVKRAGLLEALTGAFADDPAKPQVHGFTRLGLAEITRPRRSASLLEKQGLGG